MTLRLRPAPANRGVCFVRTDLGNVTIPAQGSNSVTFPPISSDAINNNPAIEGATATLRMTFRGETVEGTTITQVALRQLVVEICT